MPMRIPSANARPTKPQRLTEVQRKTISSIPIQPSLLILDFYQKMYGLYCHRRNALSTLRSSVTEPSPSLAKVTKSTAPELLMNPNSPSFEWLIHCIYFNMQYPQCRIQYALFNTLCSTRTMLSVLK